MESLTRPALSLSDVLELLRGALGPDCAIVEHEEFTDGYFNAAHAVTLADGRRLVVKVAPDADLTLLRYEDDLMATEIDFFQRAAAAGVPVPRLWHADAAAGLIIMDRCSGRLLREVKDTMDPDTRLELRRRIGALCAVLNAVTGEEFGYPFRDGHTRSSSWAASFAAMVDDLLADAEDFDRDLSRPTAEIRAMVAAEAALLDAVETPALVHFDLWDGNIFVRPDELGWEVEAIIDGERAFWGDPLFELVSLVTFITPEEAAAVVDGYLGRPLTADEERRLCLYRIYLWTVLVVEGATRGYPDDEQRQAWARAHLVEDLARLDRPWSAART